MWGKLTNLAQTVQENILLATDEQEEEAATLPSAGTSSSADDSNDSLIQLDEQNKLIQQLKDMIRDKDQTMASKDRDLEDSNAKHSKLKLQAKAKIVSLNQQLDQLRKTSEMSGEQDTDSVSAVSGLMDSPTAPSADRGKSVLLRKKLEEMDRTLADKDREISEKEELIEANKKLITHHEDKLNEQEDKLVKQEKTLEELQKNSEALQDYEDYRTELENLSSRLSSRDGEIVQLNETLQENGRLILDLQETIGEKSDVITSKDKGIQVIKESLLQKDQTIQDQLELVSSLSTKMESYEDKVRMLEQQLRISSDQQHKDSDGFDHKLAESHNYFEEMLAEKNVELQSLRDFIREKDTKLEQRDDDIHQLMRKHQIELEKISNEGTVDVQSEVLNQLEMKLKDSSEIINGKVKIIEALRDEVRHKDTEVNSQNEVTQALSEKLQIMQEHIKALESDMAKIGEDFHIERSTLIDEHQYGITERDVEISKLRSDIEQVVNTYQSAQAQYNALYEQYAVLLSENDSLRVHESTDYGFASSSESAMAVLEEKERLAAEHRKCDAKLVKLKAQYASKVKALQRDIEELKQVPDVAELVQLRTEKSSLQDDTKYLQERLDKLEKQAPQARAHEKPDYEELKTRLRVGEIKISELESENTSLQDQLQDLQFSLEERQADLSDSSSRLSDQLQAARATVSSITDERNAVMEENVRVQERMNQALSQRQDHEDELVSLNGRFLELEHSMNALEIELEEKTELVDKLTCDKAVFDEELGDALTARQEAEQEMTEWKIKCDQFETEKGSFSEQLLDKQQMIEELIPLEEKVRCLTADLDWLRAENERLQATPTSISHATPSTSQSTPSTSPPTPSSPSKTSPSLSQKTPSSLEETQVTPSHESTSVQTSSSESEFSSDNQNYIHELETKIQEMTSELERESALRLEKEDTVSELLEKSTKASSDLSELRAQIEHLNDQLRSENELVQAMNSELEQSQESCRCEKEKSIELQKKVKDLKNDLERLGEDLQIKNEDLLDTARSREYIETALENKGMETMTLHNQLADAQTRLVELQREKTGENEGDDDKFQEMEEKLAEVLKENERLIKENTELDENVMVLTRDLDHAEHDLTEKDRVIDVKDKQLESLMVMLEERAKVVLDLERTLEDLKRDLDYANESHVEERRRADELCQEVNNLNSSVNRSDLVLDEKMQSLHMVHNELASAQTICEHLETSVRAKTNEIDDLSQSLRLVTEKLGDYGTLKANTRETVQSLKVHIETLSEESDAVRASLTESEGVADQLRQELDAAHRDYTAQYQELKAKFARSQELVSQNLDDIEMMEERIQMLEAQGTDDQQLKDDLEHLRSENSSLKSDLSNSKSEFDTVRLSLAQGEDTIVSLNQKVTDNQTKLDEYDLLCSELRNSMGQIGDQLTSLSGDLESSRESERGLRDELEVKKKFCDQLAERLDFMNDEMNRVCELESKLKVDNETLSQDLEMTKQELSLAEARIGEKEKRINDHVQQLDQVNEEVFSSTVKIAALQRELQQKHVDLKALEEKLMKLDVANPVLDAESKLRMVEAQLEDSFETNPFLEERSESVVRKPQPPQIDPEAKLRLAEALLQDSFDASPLPPQSEIEARLRSAEDLLEDSLDTSQNTDQSKDVVELPPNAAEAKLRAAESMLRDSFNTSVEISASPLDASRFENLEILLQESLAKETVLQKSLADKNAETEGLAQNLAFVQEQNKINEEKMTRLSFQVSERELKIGEQDAIMQEKEVNLIKLGEKYNELTEQFKDYMAEFQKLQDVVEAYKKRDDERQAHEVPHHDVISDLPDLEGQLTNCRLKIDNLEQQLHEANTKAVTLSTELVGKDNRLEELDLGLQTIRVQLTQSLNRNDELLRELERYRPANEREAEFQEAEKPYEVEKLPKSTEKEELVVPAPPKENTPVKISSLPKEKKLALLMQKAKAFKLQAETLSEELHRIKAELTDVSEAREDLTELVKVQEERIALFLEENTNLKQQLESAFEEIDALKSDIELRCKEKDQLLHTVSGREEQLRQMMQEIQTRNEQIMNLAAQKASLEQTRSATEDSTVSLMDEISTLSTRVQDINGENERLHGQMEKARKIIEALKKRVADRDSTIADLSQRQDQTPDVTQDDVSTPNLTDSSLTHELHEAKDMVKTLETRLEDALKTVEATRQDRDDKLESLMTNLDEVESRLEIVSSDNDDMSAKLEKVRIECDNNQELILEKDKQLSSLRSTLEEKTDRVKSIEDDIEKKEAKITSYIAMIKKLKQLAKSKSESPTQSPIPDEMLQKFQDLLSEKGTLEAELDLAKQQYTELRDSVVHLEGDLKRVQIEKDNALQCAQMLETRVVTLEEESDNIKEEFTEVCEKEQQLQQESKAKYDELNNLISDKDRVIAQLSTDNQTEVERLTARIQELNDQCDSLKEKVTATISNSDFNDMKRQNSELEKTLGETLDRLAEGDGECTQLRAELEESRFDLEKLEKDMMRKEEELLRLQSQVEEISDLEAQISHFKDKKRLMEKIINEKETYLTDLGNQVQTYSVKAEQLEEELESAHKNAETLQSTLDVRDKELEDIHEKFETEKTEKQAFVEQVVTLTEELKEVKSVQESAEVFNDAQRQCDELKAIMNEKVSNAQKTETELTVRVDQLHADNEHLKTTISYLKNDLDCMVQKHDDAATTRENLKMEMKSQIETSALEYDKLATQLKDSLVAISQFEAGYAEALRQVEERDSKLQSLQAQIDTVAQPKDAAVQELNEIKIRLSNTMAKLNQTMAERNQIQAAYQKLRVGSPSTTKVIEAEVIQAETTAPLCLSSAEPRQVVKESEHLRQSAPNDEVLVLREKNQNLLTDNDQMKSRLEVLGIKSEKLLLKLKQFKEKNDKLQTQVYDLQSRLQTADDADRRNMSDAASMRRTIGELNVTLRAEETKRFSPVPVSSPETDARVLDLQNQLSNIKMEKDELESQFRREKSDLEFKITSLLEQIRVLETRCEQINSQYRSLEKDNGHYQELVSNIKSAQQTYEKRLVELMNENSELQRRLQTQNELCEKLSAERDHLLLKVSDISDLDEKLHIAEELRDQLAENLEALQKEIGRVTSQNVKLSQRVNELEQLVDDQDEIGSELDDYKSALLEAQAENRDLVGDTGSRLEAMKQEITRTKTQYMHAKAKLQQLTNVESEYVTLNDQYSSLAGENGQMVKQIEGLHARLMELQHLQNDSESLQRKNDQISDEMSKLESDVQEQAALRNVNAELETRIRDLNTELNKMSKVKMECAQLKKEKSELIEKLLQLQSEESRIVEKQTQRLQQSNAEIEGKSETNLLRQQLQDRVTKVSELTRERDALSQAYKQILNENKNLQAQLELLNVQFEDLMSTEKNSNSEVQKLRGDLAELRAENERIFSELRLSGNTDSQYTVELEALRNDLRRVTEAKVRIESDLHEAVRKVHEIDIKYQQLSMQLTQIVDERNHILQRLAHVQRDLNERERDHQTLTLELRDREKELICLHGECEVMRVAKSQMESCVSFEDSKLVFTDDSLRLETDHPDVADHVNVGDLSINVSHLSDRLSETELERDHSEARCRELEQSLISERDQVQNLMSELDRLHRQDELHITMEEDVESGGSLTPLLADNNMSRTYRRWRRWITTTSRSALRLVRARPRLRTAIAIYVLLLHVFVIACYFGLLC